MKEYSRDIWIKYHNHAPEWLEQLADGKVMGNLFHDFIPIIPPEPVSTLSSEVLFSQRSPITIITRYSSTASQRFMRDTSKCTPSPWVYKTELYLKDIDVPWFDKIYGDMTPNWPSIRKDLMDGAEELSQVKPCYDLTDMGKFAAEDIKLDIEEIINGFMNNIESLVS